MTDQEIEQAAEALRRLLRKHRECRFGKITGTVEKGRLSVLLFYSEEAGILNGKMVVEEQGA